METLSIVLIDFGDQSSPIVGNLFSSVVLVAIITTVAAPIGLRMTFSSKPARKGQSE
jgi:uncharacterized protein (UPF0212 family)